MADPYISVQNLYKVFGNTPQKITPLIKRLRVSLEFTDIAPFLLYLNACQTLTIRMRIYDVYSYQ